MAGKANKVPKPKPSKVKSKPLTFEEKLADTKSRMNVIVEGDDPKYHLR